MSINLQYGITERPMPFQINLISPNTIKISFHEMVFANSFFQYGSDIQKLLEKRVVIDKTSGNQIDVSTYNDLIIDLEQTNWFDTLAMGYLLLFLYDAKEIYKDNQSITFNLPTDPTFSAFLADYGFIDHMRKLDMHIAEDHMWDDVYYSDVHDCLAKFDVFDSREELDDKVNNIRPILENAFSTYIENERLDNLINKIAYFLHETMENVFDHAYDSLGRCGYLIVNVECSNCANYKEYDQKYLSKTPYLKINVYEDIDSCIEVYVMDTGRGLVESYGEFSGITDKNILQYIFEQGKRSYKKAKDEATRFGGLHDIRELFAQDSDGLGVKGDSVWKYVYNNESFNEEPINLLSTSGNYENLVHGFALVASVRVPKKQSNNNDMLSQIELWPNTMEKLLFMNNDDNTRLFKTANIIDERWDKKEETNAGCINTVIYPPTDALKPWIIRKIYDNKSRYLFFLEVPDVELKKYESNISGIKKTSKVVADIIWVVSKSLSVRCFKCGEDLYFSHSIEDRNKYIKKEFSERDNITDSLTALLIFDKIYNSYRFWETAKFHTGNSSIIREPIVWSKTLELSSYFDFSQIYRIPECREICIQKLNELRVLKRGAYFISVDRFTDEICERANYLMEGDREGKKIYVASVSVSGTSNRLLHGTDECFYFLCHKESPLNNVKSLLIWIRKLKSEEKDAEQNIPLKKLERLGSSSFVARGGAGYWLEKHYSLSAKGYKLNNSTLYELLQRKIGIHPDTLKIGHFESVERHDLFGYRINYWFDSDAVDRQLISDYKTESVFDFLLTNTFFSLFGNIKKEVFYEHLNENLSGGKKDALWNKYLEARKELDGETSKRLNEISDGIFVYCYDFQTTMVIEKIEKFINKESVKRIIPLIPMSRFYEMGSLVVSPLILDRIQSLINDLHNKDQKAVITVFDSVVFSVRTIEEVKQILYGLGADTVKVLTVIDRRRIPIPETKPSIVALGRVDSPALHGNDKCVICQAIEKLKNCKDVLNNNELIERISDIVSRWQCIQLSDKEYMKGLNSNRIVLSATTNEIINNYCKSYFGKELKIELDSALCSLVVEYTIISSSSELLLRLLDEPELLISDNGNISSNELKLLLVSSFLLLFANNPISNKEINAISLKLIDLLDQQQSISLVSGLALIAICSLPDIFLRSLVEQYELIEMSNSHLSLCYDALIARIISLQITQMMNNTFLLELRTRCLLKEDNSKLACLYDVFMYSEKTYRNSHRHAFACILDEPSNSIGTYKAAIDYTRKLQNIIASDTVFKSLFHNKEELEKNRDKIVEATEKAIEDLDRLIINYTKNKKIDDELAETVRDSVRTFTNSLVELNTCNLYLKTVDTLGSPEEKSISEWMDYCIQAAKDRVPESETAEIKYKIMIKAGTRLWFYSFYDVTEEVINLMVDILQYNSGKLQKGDMYGDGIVIISFTERCVELRFYNKTILSKDISEIKYIKESKSNRDSMLVFKELERRLCDIDGIKMECFNWDYKNWKVDGQFSDVFVALMRIPYINQGSSGGTQPFIEIGGNNNG